MKIELLSIRNRSSGPLPVRIRLEYNQRQILHGDLELSVYDAIEDINPSDLMATIRHEGITLAGADYEFNTILPPLKTSLNQNWAVTAYFVTSEERIPLSSVRDRNNPPEPHDLLTTSPAERGTLICSCSWSGDSPSASQNRRFLENALALDNYNPGYTRWAALEKISPERTSVERRGHVLIPAVGSWSADEMPEDPLSYCAFDVVLVSDGGLNHLGEEQLEGLTKWVRAGGSICLAADEPMKPVHLEFLRQLFGQVSSTSDLMLDSDGRLLASHNQPDGVLCGHFGLGRAVLMPGTASLESTLTPAAIGRAVAFLWKVRKSQPVWKGEKWQEYTILDVLNIAGVAAQQDDYGVYITDLDQLTNLGLRSYERRNRKFYVNWEQVARKYGMDDRLTPKTEPLLALSEQALLPADVEMVPTWVIGIILTGYILAIGPVDYFLLGWLRLRKYTWVVFPIVTALFTILTVAVANSYLASDDTGGKLVITDLVDDGVAARQTVLETLYYSAQSESRTDHRNELIVQGEDFFTAADWIQMYGQNTDGAADAPLAFTGKFPHSYTVSQHVQQWSPVSLRTLSLEPGETKVPDINWNDATLVSTDEGRERLKLQLKSLAVKEGLNYYALVLHQDLSIPILGRMNAEVPNDQRLQGFFYSPLNSRETLTQQMLSSIPTARRPTDGIFRLVSQISPEGASSLEDLAFMDSSDPDQWALVVVRAKGEEFFAFRKLYLIPQSSGPPAEH